MVSDLQIEEIEMRALRATREPWKVEYLGDNGYPQRITDNRATIVAEVHEGTGDPAPNAEFIAAARTDVLVLIAEVRRLRKELGSRG